MRASEDIGIPPKALKRRKPMTSELSQHDKDFAHAMALKLRLSRERKAAEEKEQKLIVFLCQSASSIYRKEGNSKLCQIKRSDQVIV